MKTERKIKGVKSQISRINDEIDTLKIQISRNQKEVTLKRKTIKELEDHVSKLGNSGEIRVSEHAIIRYLERVGGMDIEAIERQILSEDVLNSIKTFGGNGTYPSGEYKAIVKDYVIVTIT